PVGNVVRRLRRIRTAGHAGTGPSDPNARGVGVRLSHREQSTLNRESPAFRRGECQPLGPTSGLAGPAVARARGPARDAGTTPLRNPSTFTSAPRLSLALRMAG